MLKGCFSKCCLSQFCAGPSRSINKQKFHHQELFLQFFCYRIVFNTLEQMHSVLQNIACIDVYYPKDQQLGNQEIYWTFNKIVDLFYDYQWLIIHNTIPPDFSTRAAVSFTTSNWCCAQHWCRLWFRVIFSNTVWNSWRKIVNVRRIFTSSTKQKCFLLLIIFPFVAHFSKHPQDLTITCNFLRLGKTRTSLKLFIIADRKWLYSKIVVSCRGRYLINYQSTIPIIVV